MSKSQAAALAAYATDADLRAAKVRMGEALPETGWLHTYLSTVTPLTDAPVEFHLASGLSAIAGAVGNRMHVQSWGQQVYPHLWAVLVAPSSFWRKSTSINVAEALLRDAASAKLMPSDFSREKFLGILSDQPDGMLTLKEFGGFLAMMGRDYSAGMKENLTELFDGPDEFKRALQKDTISIRRPALTILAATTLDWLESRITDGDLRSGFLARFLFITAKEKATAKGLTGGLDPIARMNLVDGLKYLSEIPDAPVEYARGVREQLDDWMHGWEEEVSKTHHRSDLSGFAVRLQTYALKLAMLYRASECAVDENLSPAVLDSPNVSRAIAYCRVLWANVAGLIDDDIAITREAKDLRRTLGIIGAGITRSDALKLSKMKARDFDALLDTLIQSHQVTMEPRRSSEVGLERQRDSMVKWIAPLGRNGSSPGLPVLLEFPGVPLEFPPSSSLGIPGEPEGNRKNGELEGNSKGIPSTDFPSTSPSPLLSTDDSHDDRDIRARDGEPEADDGSLL